MVKKKITAKACLLRRRVAFKPRAWAPFEDKIVYKAVARLDTKEKCSSVSLMAEIKWALPKRSIGQIRARFLYYRNMP